MLPVAICALTLLVSIAPAQNLDPRKPNVVVIYADDLGYGDVGAYNPAGLVPTPHMDALRAQGMMFTRAHSASGVCTPSRYSLLTGRYSWRLATDGILPSGVTWDYSTPVIQDHETTIGDVLQQQGYHTACFGKWHLGMQHFDRNGIPFTGTRTTINDPSKIDMTRVEQTVVDRGFDYFWGMPNTINIAPYCWMENDTILFQGAPVTTNSPWQVKNDALWEPGFEQIDASPVMISNAVTHIAAQATNAEPFFVYVSLFSPHKPWVVTPAFDGSVGYTYGDFVRLTDHWVGQVVDAIDNSGVSSNTLVILTSDNGPETSAFTGSRTFGHDSNGPLKGVKRDSWEGGTRVPFIARWPGVVATNSTSGELVWQGDIFATIAEHLGTNLAASVAPDAESFLPILQGNPMPTNRRPSVAIASIDNQLSLCTVDGWKLIDGTGGGGNGTSYDADNVNIASAHGTIGGSPKQLFDLTTDLGERTNLVTTFPAKAAELLALLNAHRALPSVPTVLLDHWTFDESGGVVATNVTGGTNGTFTGGVTINQDGRMGRACAFDAAANGVVTALGYKGVLGSTPRTVSFWLNTTNFNTGKGLVSWGEQATSKAWELILDAGRLRFNVNGGNVIGSTPLNDGEWRHLAVSFADSDGNPSTADVTLFIDGEVESPSSRLSIAVATAGALDVAIGVDRFRENYYSGLLDDVAIWQGGLAAAEIRALHELADEPPLNYDASQAWDLIEAYGIGPGASVTVDGTGWSYATGLTATADGRLATVGGRYALVMDSVGGSGMRADEALEGQPPTIVHIAWDQADRNDTGSAFFAGTGIASGDLVCRERANDFETDIQGVAFIKFDVSHLTTQQVNAATFRATLSSMYASRLNTTAGNNLAVSMSALPEAYAWDNVSGQYPLVTWVGSTNLATGLGLTPDHALVFNVLAVAPPRPLVCDVTHDVRDWVNGVRTNNGFVIYGTTDANQGAGFSDPRLDIAYHPMLVDHWPLDETSGTTTVNRAGSAKGTIGVGVTVGQPGRVGRACVFDGSTNGAVTVVGYKGILGNMPRTVSAWVKPTGTGGLVSWGRDTASDAWDLEIDANDTVGSLRCNVSSAFARDTVDLRGAGWQHVAVTFTHGSHRNTLLYVNGFVVGAIQGGGALNGLVTTVAGLDVAIGVDRQRLEYLEGAVDDVAVWRSALVAGEVRALHGLAIAPSLGYDASQVQALFEAYALGTGAEVTVGETTWRYATGLAGSENGQLDLAGGRYLLVLDAAEGTGLSGDVAPPGSVLIVR